MKMRTAGVTHYTRLCISAFVFECREEHQCPIRGHGRSCSSGPLKCARSFTDSLHHFDSGNYKSRPYVVYHSENPPELNVSRFTSFLLRYAALRREATSTYPEDGDSMFLRNVGVSLQLHIASRPRRTSTSLQTWSSRLFIYAFQTKAGECLPDLLASGFSE
jgi:hypothetical protein